MKIGAVLVTYNRLAQLQAALACYDRQTRLPSYLIVVDNASTDGTSEWLREWQTIDAGYRKTVITNAENLGGSGGFYVGFRAVLETDCDWVWVSDDDAYPDPNAFDVAYQFLVARAGENIAAICGQVISNGAISYSHRTRYVTRFGRILIQHCPQADYAREWFELNAFSYVGAMIRVDLLRQVGLPEKDYFIWLDDTEHSLRLSKAGKIYCVPAIRVNHDADDKNEELTWKDYYGFRNRVDMYSRHFRGIPYALFILKRSLGTVWLMLFARNHDFALIFRDALCDGIHHRLGLHEVYRPGWRPENTRKG